ncbi:MAG: DUF3108 domain-containing protein [Pseudomonadota bacterium]
MSKFAKLRAVTLVVLLMPSLFLTGPCFAETDLAEANVAPSDGPAPNPQEEQVRATYKVGVSAIDLGKFNVAMAVTPKTYTLTATGEFSVLGGLVYRAEGQLNANGTHIGSESKPQRFDFSYSDQRNEGSLQIGFGRGTVRSVTRKPKKRPDKKAVPIPEDQLADVLDPLTAAFFSIHAELPPGDLAICNQTLRVFDGKRRFDLTLSPKRKVGLSVNAPMGLPAAAVCKVDYQPIGGHRAQNETVNFLKNSGDIEVWLVPVPGTGITLPYKVVLPTAWGEGRIALVSLKAAPATVSHKEEN